MILYNEIVSRVTANPNLGVSYYLTSSWAYYQLNQSYMEDTTFDWLAKFLLGQWDSVKHRHKHLITKGELQAGTLLLSKESYPEIVKDTAKYLLKSIK